MASEFRELQGVVFDWAGTTVDYGSRAPAFVFQEIFRQRGVPITVAQAREPMGKAKRDHIHAVASMPDVATAWKAKHGSDWTDADIDAMYEEFLPLQKSVLGDYCQVLDGVVDLTNWLKENGLKIGSSTGYTRELMDDVVIPAAAKQGYTPDFALGAEDAHRGRPSPFLLHEAACRMDVYPMWRIVKVDDTPVGIEAGRNAGCFTVGVTQTGNCVGLSEDEFKALSETDQKSAIARAESKLNDAGAHATVNSLADIRPVLAEFDQRLAEGERPKFN